MDIYGSPLRPRNMDLVCSSLNTETIAAKQKANENQETELSWTAASLCVDN